MASPALSVSLNKLRRELIKFWLSFRRPLIIGAIALTVLVGGWLAWASLQSSMEESAQRQIDKQAEWAAKDVKSTLVEQIELVDTQLDFAALATLATLVAAGDSAALSAQESALAGAIENAVGVRVLERKDDRRPDYDAKPPVTYASLEMMRAAVQEDAPPRPEVLLFGQDEQHVAVVRALRNEAGDAVIGFVLIGLDAKRIIATFARSQFTAAYAELSQGAGKSRQVLARKGSAALKQGVPALTVPISGTIMRVSLWPDKGEPAQEEEAGLPIELIAGVAVLLLCAVGGLVFVRKRKAGPDANLEDTSAPSAVSLGLTDKLAALDSTDAVNEGTAGDAAQGMDGVEDGESAKTEMSLSDEIFRAYDVRGVVGKTLTVEVVKQLGLAIGSEAYDRAQQTLCVARDGRASSPELAAALIEGLRESGRDVIDIGEAPTPVLYFSTYYLETGSGVMITGSHNPPEYNGLKIMLGGDTLFGDDIQALKQRMLDKEFASGAGNLQAMDISADYIRRVSEDIPVALGNAFKVVVDCGNGVAGNFAPKLIRALGHDVVELFCDVDGTFPNHHPDPSQPENMQDLIAAVKENDADLGFAFDGDGDRLGVVDSNGNIIWPDAQMMLYARDVLSRNPGAEIVFDVKCTSRLGKVISKLGGKPVMFKTGHSFMKNKLKETGAPLAGEMSGHIFFKERWYGFDDALYTSARMLEIMMGFKQRPAEVFAKLPAGVSTPELKVEMNEGENLQFMESLGDVEFEDATLSSIDGIRIDWPNRWGLVRASNTTPSLVLRFEGDDEQALEEVKDTFRKLLLEKRPNMSLPF